uniref:Uncharacterized protein n=1 Tax=Anopheles albimanus TaxID=7167 RepID=A0A182FYF6_ANOAL
MRAISRPSGGFECVLFVVWSTICRGRAGGARELCKNRARIKG